MGRDKREEPKIEENRDRADHKTTGNGILSLKKKSLNIHSFRFSYLNQILQA